jgi:probable HAF family extracellular repeat protein
MINKFVKLPYFVAALFISGNAAAAGFFPLSDLAGGDSNSQALAISGDGSTVVGQGTSASGTEAFSWTSGGGMVGLGDLAGGDIVSRAYAVSDDGSIVVGESSSTASGINRTEAFIWSGGGMIGLSDLSGGNFDSEARGISADGSTVVGIGTSASGVEAFSWTSGGGMVGLGDLAGSVFHSEARGISADGSQVVGTSVSTPAFEAFTLASGGSMVGLGHLGGGCCFSYALAASSDGSTVVGRSDSALGLQEAFAWTSGTGLQPLGDLPGGDFNSTARAVSADGSVVVGTGTVAPGGTAAAFVWTNKDGMQSVMDLAIAEGITGLTDWELLGAHGISADGSSIVGAGKNSDGLTEAWMVTLPDTDADGRPDYIDNCASVQNTAAFPDSEGWDPQQDTDSDDIGNACDLVIPAQFVRAARVGKFYNHQLIHLRGTGPFTWTMISGFLPNALTLGSDGVISGNTIAGGITATFTARVMDSTGDAATRIFKLRSKIPGCYNCHEAARF